MPRRTSTWCLMALGCLWLSSGLHAQTVEYIHTDALASPVTVTNSAGVVIERREYEPYEKQTQLVALANGPGAPPHSPNFCGPSVCLEVSVFPSFDLEISSSTKLEDGSTSFKLAGKRGITVVSIKDKKGQDCVGDAEIDLVPSDGSITASGLVSKPDGSGCMLVKIVDSPVGQVESVRGNFPISALWAVDRDPSTFWEKGYALRLGPQVSIFWRNP